MMLRSENGYEHCLALLLVALGVIFRLVPHAWNFAPVAAAALFAGAVLPPVWALTVPVAIMALSDVLIGPHPLMAVTWGCFFAVSLIGIAVSKRPRPSFLIAGALGGSLLFFIVTNFAVFAFQDFYPKTWAGLATCYQLAVPFYRNTLLGDLFFTAVLFGIFALAKSRLRLARPQSRS